MENLFPPSGLSITVGDTWDIFEFAMAVAGAVTKKSGKVLFLDARYRQLKDDVRPAIFRHGVDTKNFYFKLSPYMRQSRYASKPHDLGKLGKVISDHPKLDLVILDILNFYLHPMAPMEDWDEYISELDEYAKKRDLVMWGMAISTKKPGSRFLETKHVNNLSYIRSTGNGWKGTQDILNSVHWLNRKGN